MGENYITENLEIPYKELKKIWQARLGDTVYVQVFYQGIYATVKVCISKLTCITIRELESENLLVPIKNGLTNYFSPYGVDVTYSTKH